LQVESAGQDAVVGNMRIHAGRQEIQVRVQEHEELATAGQRDPRAQGMILAQGVDGADDLAGVAAPLVVLALEVVQFLEHVAHENDVVLLEGLQGGGVVEQDVGVEQVATAFQAGQVDTVRIQGMLSRGCAHDPSRK
jgi:hypothetical protein